MFFFLVLISWPFLHHLPPLLLLQLLAPLEVICGDSLSHVLSLVEFNAVFLPLSCACLCVCVCVVCSYTSAMIDILLLLFFQGDAGPPGPPGPVSTIKQ